jgi:hypothetical protein
MDALIELAQRLEDTAFATALAESRYAYPILEGFHLIGLSLSVGLIALIDLRLTGRFLRTIPSDEVLRQLRPWMLAGFALSFASGFLLFSAEAVNVVRSPAFPFKILFILLAGANALYFEFHSRGLAVRARAALAGAASLTLWFLVVATGRLIPYLTSW